MTSYQRHHHQIIEKCLRNFNADYLREHRILFGGGTRISLELNEYRQSVDIDFLCADKASYRAVRSQVSETSLGVLVHKEFDYARDVRFDRYGVRTLIKADDLVIKLEFVAFDDYQLAIEPKTELFPVPAIDHTSCFMTKLLAHADRLMQEPLKVLFDLIVMFSQWGMIPKQAMEEAFSHYGATTVKGNLVKGLQHMLDNEPRYLAAAMNMGIDQKLFQEQILPAASRLLAELD
ncbi:MAG: nucleotidyl transferase AbiEii/AbiGii toxin family protein [Gammaproteobacteria bacterium]|nr:nucleotidyl transferase AbiEii/AbiGii toxin family protein [Gammaproteobacteria bacterium]